MCAWLPYLLLILKEYSWNLLWICTFLGFFGEDLYGKDYKDPSRRLFRSDMIKKRGKTRLTNILHGTYFASFILLPNPPFFWCGEMPFFCRIFGAVVMWNQFQRRWLKRHEKATTWRRQRFRIRRTRRTVWIYIYINLLRIYYDL